MYWLRGTFSLLLYPVLFRLGESNNIFITTPNADDDDGNRHDVEKPSYNIFNPPTRTPTGSPSHAPSNNMKIPSNNPTKIPSFLPSFLPSDTPSPSVMPSRSNIPSKTPSNIPSKNPSSKPSKNPSSKPSKKPSNKPSKSPSVAKLSLSPTKEACKTDGDGAFGSTGSQLTSTKVTYRYEVDMDMSKVNSTATDSSQADLDEAVLKRIGPNIKTELTNSLFPSLFDQCGNTAGNTTNPAIGFTNLQGMSTKPDDAMNANGCGASNASCAMVDGGYTLYFPASSTRRKLTLKESLDKFVLLIKNTLESKKMLGADPAIIRIRFIETTTVTPIVVPQQIAPAATSTSTSTSSWWIYVVAGGAAGLLIAGAVIVYRRKKNDDNDSSVSEGSSNSQSSSDEEVTWNYAIQSELKKAESTTANTRSVTGNF
jgi:LPXTG-motif cell wall-anchored protein